MQRELSLYIGGGGQGQAVSISSTSAQSALIPSDHAVIYSTVDTFARWGADPTALATGVDYFIPAAQMFRVSFPDANGKLAFKTSSASGTVYIQSGA